MANTNLVVNRGTTYTMGFQYKKDGVNSTLVGATVRFTIKDAEYDENSTDSTAVLVKNVTSGNSAGYAEIAISPDDIPLVEPSKYYYDIKVEEASGDIYKVVEGRFTLDGSPTNRLT